MWSWWTSHAFVQIYYSAPGLASSFIIYENDARCFYFESEAFKECSHQDIVKDYYHSKQL